MGHGIPGYVWDDNGMDFETRKNGARALTGKDDDEMVVEGECCVRGV